MFVDLTPYPAFDCHDVFGRTAGPPIAGGDSRSLVLGEGATPETGIGPALVRGSLGLQRECP